MGLAQPWGGSIHLGETGKVNTVTVSRGASTCFRSVSVLQAQVDHGKEQHWIKATSGFHRAIREGRDNKSAMQRKGNVFVWAGSNAGKLDCLDCLDCLILNVYSLHDCLGWKVMSVSLSGKLSRQWHLQLVSPHILHIFPDKLQKKIKRRFTVVHVVSPKKQSW